MMQAQRSTFLISPETLVRVEGVKFGEQEILACPEIARSRSRIRIPPVTDIVVRWRVLLRLLHSCLRPVVSGDLRLVIPRCLRALNSRPSLQMSQYVPVCSAKHSPVSIWRRDRRAYLSTREPKDRRREKRLERKQPHSGQSAAAEFEGWPLQIRHAGEQPRGGEEQGCCGDDAGQRPASRGYHLLRMGVDAVMAEGA